VTDPIEGTDPGPSIPSIPSALTAPRRPGRAGRIVGWMLVVATVAAVVVGATTLIAGRRADDRAHTARRRAAATLATQRAVARTTELVNHQADAPIGRSEQVAYALSHIDEAAGTVLIDGGAVQDVLGEAVGKENNEGRGAGRPLYLGRGHDAVTRMQDGLRHAQDTLADALKAAAELKASAT
jgi:hypothetical protein